MIERCTTCHAPIRRIHDQPRAGIPLTIDATPTTWRAALRAVITGRPAVLRDTHRQHWRATSWRIPAGPQPGDTIHIQHRCGAPGPPPPTTRNPPPTIHGDQPPY
jgi:hypothetical protein